MIALTIPGQPQGKARARVGKWGTYTPEKTVMYENLVKTLYIEKYNTNKLDGALLMRVEAFYSIPKSVTKKVRDGIRTGEILPTVKPDLDNVLKVIMDSLNGIAYDDDKQVVGVILGKMYDITPRVEIIINKA